MDESQRNHDAYEPPRADEVPTDQPAETAVGVVTGSQPRTLAVEDGDRWN